jgi:hypothetical protein
MSNGMSPRREPWEPRRRTVLASGVTAAAVGVVAWALDVPPAAATTPPDRTRWSPRGVRVSANGWPIESAVGPSQNVQELRLVGTPAHVRLRLADVATILMHVVRRFHYDVAALDAGQVVGFRPGSVLSTRHESNHASGTAVDIRREWYPAGTRGGFSATELVVIRDILAESEGIVRWGGDYRYSPDESHFQIDVPPTDARVSALARKLRIAAGEPDGGPGTEAQLPFIPRRMTEARRLAARQAGAV